MKRNLLNRFRLDNSHPHQTRVREVKTQPHRVLFQHCQERAIVYLYELKEYTSG